jgi:hypothetical protein
VALVEVCYKSESLTFSTQPAKPFFTVAGANRRLLIRESDRNGIGEGSLLLVKAINNFPHGEKFCG